jgi:hypothetical protein
VKFLADGLAVQDALPRVSSRTLTNDISTTAP